MKDIIIVALVTVFCIVWTIIGYMDGSRDKAKSICAEIQWESPMCKELRGELLK